MVVGRGLFVVGKRGSQRELLSLKSRLSAGDPRTFKTCSGVKMGFFTAVSLEVAVLIK